LTSPYLRVTYIHDPKINAYVRRFAQEFHPERVILFGSYAHGRPTSDSDVDLLVRTPTEIKKRIALRDVFMLSILKQGRVMYERRRSGMVGEGRRRLRNGHAGIWSATIA